MLNRLSTIEAATYSRRALWFLGLYQGKRHLKYSFFGLIRAGTLTFLAAFPSLMLIYIFTCKTEIAVLIKTVYFFSLLIWVMWRTLLHIRALPKMRAVEDRLEDEIFNMQNERQDRFILAVVAKQRYLYKFYMPIIVVIAFFFVVYPIVTKQFAIIPIWTPFTANIENIVAYIVESCCALELCFLYPALDCVLFGFTNTVVAQIEILKDNLERATDRNSHEDYTKQEGKIQERLRMCIIHHNAILDLTSRVEDLFSAALFLQIVSAVLEICLGGMQLVIEKNPVQLLFWVVCFISTIAKIMWACWCGQEIITESEGIIETCYMSDWYTCTPSTRKLYVIIMEEAKRPIAISGGYFFTLSFNIFVNILRSAYSYYAVFSQVYEK